MVAIINQQRMAQKPSPPQPAKAGEPDAQMSIQRLTARVDALQEKLTVVLKEMAEHRARERSAEVESLISLAAPRHPARTIEDVVTAVSVAFGVRIEDLRGPRRMHGIAHPRQACFFLCRKYCPQASLPQIGKRFGNRDHSTVLHGLRVVPDRIKLDPEYAAKMAAAETLLIGVSNG